MQMKFMFTVKVFRFVSFWKRWFLELRSWVLIAAKRLMRSLYYAVYLL